MEQRDSAEGPERDRLGAQIIELEGRLRNIEPAFEAAQTRIRELEQLLEREGNQLGHEKVERAEKALAAGDFDEADELLADISAEEDLAVQRKARAEFGRGQIAEEQVRWHDAAEHYDNAARLNRTFEHLRKAREFQWRSGNYQRADALGSMLIDAAMSEFGESSEQHAAALNNHALTLKDMGRYGEAEPLCQQAIEIGKATIGEAHPAYAIRLNNLASLLKDIGRHEEAEPLFRQAMDITKASLGEAHPDYATDLKNLAGLLRDMGRQTEAEPLYRQAIEIDKATIGEAHPNYAIHLNNLANLLRDMGKPDDAKPLYSDAISVFRTSLGDDHPSTKQVADNQARLLRKHFPDDPALAELEATFGPDIGK